MPALDWLDHRRLLVRIHGNDSPDNVEQNVLRALVHACPPCADSSASSVPVATAVQPTRTTVFARIEQNPGTTQAT